MITIQNSRICIAYTALFIYCIFVVADLITLLLDYGQEADKDMVVWVMVDMIAWALPIIAMIYAVPADEGQSLIIKLCFWPWQTAIIIWGIMVLVGNNDGTNIFYLMLSQLTAQSITLLLDFFHSMVVVGKMMRNHNYTNTNLDYNDLLV